MKVARIPMLPLFLALGLFGIAVDLARADSFMIMGNDLRQSPAEYSLTGTFLGSFNAPAGSGVTFDGAGHLYVDYPEASQISEFDSAGTHLNTISYTGHFGESLAYDSVNSSIWLAGSDGSITDLSLSGIVLGSFTISTSAFVPGVAFDGTFLYTSAGLYGNDVITQRLLDGTPVSTIIAYFPGYLNSWDASSLAYDATDGTLWAGYNGEVREFRLDGTLLTSLATPDANFYHDGLTVGSFVVPEPPSLLLVGSILGAAGLFRRLLR